MSCISLRQHQVMHAKVDLLELLEKISAEMGEGQKTKAMPWLLAAYNYSRELARVYWVLGAVNSPRTVREWLKLYREQGPTGLMDRRGRPGLTEMAGKGMAEFLEACLFCKPEITQKEAHELLGKKFLPAEVPSIATVGRWIRKIKEDRHGQ